MHLPRLVLERLSLPPCERRPLHLGLLGSSCDSFFVRGELGHGDRVVIFKLLVDRSLSDDGDLDDVLVSLGFGQKNGKSSSARRLA